MSEGKRSRGRPGVTEEEVRRACEALMAQGRRIGPTNVRLELGHGSYETIIKHLRALGYRSK
ncbi:DNA-binding protein [Ramlibacter alkalitolerans]|uniref:DNA-binding protein n=1 Tax=Ramlibacter alkalitolerans TaxID=2039631 RepID=A0ABS1JNG9_9BURK|nr:DNA-binding protein [Ramlibacter alkalitolerans]